MIFKNGGITEQKDTHPEIFWEACHIYKNSDDIDNIIDAQRTLIFLSVNGCEKISFLAKEVLENFGQIKVTICEAAVATAEGEYP